MKATFFRERQNSSRRICFRLFVIFFVILSFCYILLGHGDIEVNPEPRKNCSISFSFCHWCLNSLTEDNYVKFSLLQVYSSFYEHDVICLTERYVDNLELESEESDLDFSGHKMTFQEMLKEEEYAFTLKSSFLFVF